MSEYKHALEAVKALRDLGATKVRVGEIEAEFGVVAPKTSIFPSLFDPDEAVGTQEMTPEQRDFLNYGHTT